MNLRDALAAIGDTVKLRHLGLGFVWAWIYCAFETSAVYSERAGVGINADASWLASAVAVAVSLLVGGALLRTADLARRRALPTAATLLVAVGTFVSAFVDSALASGVCGVATGVGTALLVIFWGDALARIDEERAEIAIPVASVIMLVCVFVFPYIDGILGVVAVASLPVLSMLCLFATYDDPQTEDAPAQRPQTDARRPSAWDTARLLVLVFVAYAVMGCTSSFGDSYYAFFEVYGFDAATLIGSVSGLAFAAWFIVFSPRVDIVGLFRWITPLMIVGVALLPYSAMGPEFLLVTIMAIADTVVQIIVTLHFVRIARRGHLSAAFAVGLSQGVVQLGVLLGNLLGNEAVGAIAEGTLQPWTVSLVLVCALSVATALAPTAGARPAPALREAAIPAAPPTPEPAQHGEAQPAAAHSDEAQPRPAPAPVTALEEPRSEAGRRTTLARLARDHGLTPRETEVLDYLSKGRSQPYIREELVLSKNTVNTHVKHIYQKLGVHSKQELLDLFEADGEG